MTALPKPVARTQTQTHTCWRKRKQVPERKMLIFIKFSANTHNHSRVSGGHYEAGAVGRNGFGAVFISFLVLLLFLVLTLLLVSVGVLVH